MNTELETSRLLDEVCGFYERLLAATRRLATNFTPALFAATLRERASLLRLIESKRIELEAATQPSGYSGSEQYRTIQNHAAAIVALDRTISMLVATHQDRIRCELASLPVSFRAASHYLRQSRR